MSENEFISGPEESAIKVRDWSRHFSEMETKNWGRKKVLSILERDLLHDDFVAAERVIELFYMEAEIDLARRFNTD